MGIGNPAHAQITEEPERPFPDPRKFATGVYVDAEMGSMLFLGPARNALGFGVVFGTRVGYDLTRWLSAQLHGIGSTHRTDFGLAPQSGQLIQVYQLSAELKITVPIRQISIFAFGGGGVGYLSTNLLGTTPLTEPAAQTSLMYLAGGGVDYHTLSRHFSFGLMGAWTKLLVLDAPGGVMATAYLRYTF